MFRDRLRAAARLNALPSQNANFKQSVFLVVIGALISFVSSVTTNLFSSKNENRKIELEQKVLFEKEVVACIAENSLTAKQMASLTIRPTFLHGADSNWIKKTIDSVWNANSKERQKFIVKQESIKLLMHSYSDSTICQQFDQLTSAFDYEYNDIDLYLRVLYHSAGSIELRNALYDHQQEAWKMINADNADLLKFLNDFHTAILK